MPAFDPRTEMRSFDEISAHAIGRKVQIKGKDYTYDGWVVAAFNKRSGVVRYVIEDANGRCFIHNVAQIAGPAKE